MKVNQLAPPSLGGLRGIILRDDEDTIVVKASQADIKRFGAARQSEVVVNHGRMSMDFATANAVITGGVSFVMARPGEMLYNADGAPVLRIRDASYRRDTFDVSTFSDQFPKFVQGRLRISIEGEQA